MKKFVIAYMDYLLSGFVTAIIIGIVVACFADAIHWLLQIAMESKGSIFLILAYIALSFMITMFIWVIPYSFIRKLLFVKGFYTQTNKIIPGMVINKRVHVNRHAQKTFYIKVFADDKNKEFVVSRENFNNYAIEQRIKIRKEFISHKGQLVRTELYLVN